MSINDATPVPRREPINAGVQQIPGEPGARPWKIWELFCNHQLHREARMTPHQSQIDLGVDEVHVLPNYDSPNDIKAYFLTDVGVEEGADKIDLASIPFEVYRATYDNTRQQWTFVQRPADEKYRQYCARYAWVRDSMKNHKYLPHMPLRCKAFGLPSP
ncbi:hypothetical protein Q7P35_006198 [Cladosporium inversicolor]